MAVVRTVVKVDTRDRRAAQIVASMARNPGNTQNNRNQMIALMKLDVPGIVIEVTATT